MPARPAADRTGRMPARPAADRTGQRALDGYPQLVSGSVTELALTAGRARPGHQPDAGCGGHDNDCQKEKTASKRSRSGMPSRPVDGYRPSHLAGLAHAVIVAETQSASLSFGTFSD